MAVLSVFLLLAPMSSRVGPAAADEKAIRLLAPEALAASGLLKHILPRFSFKTGISVTIATVLDPFGDRSAPAPDEIWIVVGSGGAGALRPALRQFNVFTGIQDGETTEFAAVVLAESPSRQVTAFAEWLVSDVGRRTIAAFKVDGTHPFEPAAERIEEEVTEVIPGDARRGEELSLTHCGRCHVINETNRMAGLGSTPSFAALRANAIWLERFQTFFARNPHPAFTQIEGITEPFDISRPPPIVPVEMTIEDLEAILAYVSRIKPADLGAPVRMQ